MDARLELEKSENRRYLSFIEAAYDMDDRDDFNKAFSVRLGISIPLDSGGGHEVLRRKLDALETRNRYRTLQKETAAEAEAAARQVRRQIGRYRLLKGRDARKSVFEKTPPRSRKPFQHAYPHIRQPDRGPLFLRNQA